MDKDELAAVVVMSGAKVVHGAWWGMGHGPPVGRGGGDMPVFCRGKPDVPSGDNPQTYVSEHTWAATHIWSHGKEGIGGRTGRKQDVENIFTMQ